ncbi:MAG: DUF5788 family protein [Halobacteriaceae archaeon]
MKPYERKQLLERVDREGATVGAEIPAEISLDGEPVALREFVFEVQAADRVPTEERERVEQVRTLLRRARLERRNRLEDEETALAMSREEGERLVREIVGIDRALAGLADLGETDLEAEMQAQTVADRKRWRSFLDRALGEDDGGRGARTDGGAQSRAGGGRSR